VLCSEEDVDVPYYLDPDVSFSSLSDLEKLQRVIQSDQCFIRYLLTLFIAFL